MQLSDCILAPVHVDEIRPGDLIEFRGEIKTVCAADIRRGGFMGTTIFGDSFRCGSLPVQRATVRRTV